MTLRLKLFGYELVIPDEMDRTFGENFKIRDPKEFTVPSGDKHLKDNTYIKSIQDETNPTPTPDELGGK